MKKPSGPLRTAFGEFVLHEALGEGASGAVYRATDVTGGQHAIKILDPAKATRERLGRFQNEILFGLRARHPNIIVIEDHGPDPFPFYVMPLCPHTLRRAMNDGIGAEMALRFFSQMLNGLEAAHLLGVVHRDLKPENCLISPDGQLIIADWGIAHFEQEELYNAIETRDQARLANFQYSAPEQRQRGATVGAAADIFAAGLILNEMFTREIRQGAGARRVAAVALEHAYLDDLIDELVQQDPTRRLAPIDRIKLRLSEHRVLFESRQQLDRLNAQRVVPIEVSNDPLVREPVRIVSRDYDPNYGTLVLTLNHPIHAEWATVFQAASGVTFFPSVGLTPRHVQFQGNAALLQVDADHASDAYAVFGEWLTRANADYAELDRRNRQEQERRAREALQQQREREARRQDVLKRLPEI